MMNVEKITLILSCMAILTSLVSIVIATVLAIKSWHKTRSIYNIEEFVVRRIDGSRNDFGDRGFNTINEKLGTGKFIVDSIQLRQDGDWAVIIAQIRK